MGAAQTFVGFSKNDLPSYNLMKSWEGLIGFDFNFTSNLLHESPKASEIIYVKSFCRSRMKKGDKFILLVGDDTRFRHKYNRWEAEVALEKGCTIIAVNVNGMRYLNPKLCPPVINNVGAIFIGLSPEIIGHALHNYQSPISGNYKYTHTVYKNLGCTTNV